MMIATVTTMINDDDIGVILTIIGFFVITLIFLGIIRYLVLS